MAATLITIPPSIHFASEANFAIATNQVNSQYAQINIVFQIGAPGPVALETLIFSYSEKNIVFVFVPVPNEQTELPTPQNGIDSDYIDEFLEYLQRNTDVLTDFELKTIVSGIGEKTICLQSRKVGKLNIDNVGTPAQGISMTYTDPNIEGIYKQKNLKSKVFLLNNNQIIPLSGRYTAANFGYTSGGIVQYNVGDLLHVMPYLPNPYDDALGYAIENTTEYHIRYADSYGEPEVVEPLMRSEYFTALWGSGKLEFPQNGIYTLHFTGSQDITPSQRAFFYVFNTIERQYQFAVNVHFQNGTSYQYYVLNEMTLEANKVAYFRTDMEFTDLKNTLEALNMDYKNAISYDFQLLDISGNALISRNFRIIDCEFAHKELWFVNAMGAIETVQLEVVESIETETTTATNESDIIFVNEKKTRRLLQFRTPPLSIERAAYIKMLVMSPYTHLLSDNKWYLTPLVLDSKNLATKNVREWATEPQTLTYKKAEKE